MRIEFAPHGIHVAEIGLWLDPRADCDAAWVSHGHSDHAEGRHARVIATAETIDVYKMRLGDQPVFRPVVYSEPVGWNGARLTAFPSGHMLGAAQLLIEYGGERLLYTGDVKLRPPLAGAEAVMVACDRLIIESTFGLPEFCFLDREEARARIVGFAQESCARGATPVFLAHPLGRGQEVLHALAAAGIPAAVDQAAARFVPLYERAGFEFPGWTLYDGGPPEGRALLAARGFRFAGAGAVRIAYVSGWAAAKGAQERTGADELIPYSDHADFEELLALVDRSGARQVDVVHGYTEAFTRVLGLRGLDARAH
jgi:Cft2 family RNA processing exonuclease